MVTKNRSGGSLQLFFAIGGALTLGFWLGFHAREATDGFLVSEASDAKASAVVPHAPTRLQRHEAPAPKAGSHDNDAEDEDESSGSADQTEVKKTKKLVRWRDAREQCFQLARKDTRVLLSVHHEDRPYPACGATAGDNPGFAASFRVVDAVDGSAGAFSLESCRNPKHYLRHNGNNVVVEPAKVPPDAVWRLPDTADSKRTCVVLQAFHGPGRRVRIDKMVSPVGSVQMSQSSDMCLEMQKMPTTRLVAQSDCAANRVSDAVKVASMADGQPCELVPLVQCPKLLPGAQIGEHSLCETTGLKRDLQERTCLVYGIGVSDNWDFEVAMAEKGCEVHAFDPTIDNPPTSDGDRLPNLHFHRWGLAMESSETGTHKVAGTKSGATETSQPMLTLADIMQRLGHGVRRLSVFKVDCEGCEWASLSAVPGDVWSRIDQLSFELHYGTALMLDSPKQLRRAAMVADALRSNGFADWRSELRDGYEHHRILLPELSKAGMPQGYCCRLSAFVRLASMDSSGNAAFYLPPAVPTPAPPPPAVPPVPTPAVTADNLVQWSEARSQCFHLARRGAKTQLSVRSEIRSFPACQAFSGSLPPYAASFRVVDALDGTANGFSLESCRHPGNFLRHNGMNVVVEPPKVPGDTVWLTPSGPTNGCVAFRAAHFKKHALHVDSMEADGVVQMVPGKGQCLEMRKRKLPGNVDQSSCAANNVSDAVKVASMADGQPCSLIPIVDCPNPLEGSNIGEHALCKTSAIKRDLAQHTCLVYGIGVSDNWDFEKAMAKKGCEVHAFDPTIDKPPTDESKRLPNLHFHRWGLAMETSEAGSHKVAGTLSGASETSQPMLTLADMMERLGHSNRRLSVFKIDCEGCEWASMSAVPGHLWDRIDQLSFELHYGVELLLDSAKQLRRAAAVAEALRSHGFVEWRSDVRDGWGHHRKLLPALYEAGMPKGYCCRISGYYRRAA